MFSAGTTFSYSNGVASASSGWSYNIRAAFNSQLSAQPQYKTLTQPQMTAGGIPQGAYYVANMAIGLADDDYRAKFGVMSGTNLSEFGQWIDQNRQPIWNDSAGWFSAAGGGGGGGSTGSTGGSTDGGSSSGSGFWGSGLSSSTFMWIGIAVVALLVLRD